MAQIDAKREKLSDPTIKKFNGQNFDDIKASLAGKQLWTDPEFGHDKNSLGDSLIKSMNEEYKKQFPKAKGGLEIEWKRVHEISKEAKLFIKGYCEDDVIQGLLGDCWFVAPVASLALQHSLVKKVIPHSDQQELDREDYCGILLFRFYRFGEWIEVVVDDYLPTWNNNLLFMRSNKPNEFWAALLQKAYAKLDGSYGSIDLGDPADALSDLTGGVSETIYPKNVGTIKSARQKVYGELKTALRRGSVVSLGIGNLNGSSEEIWKGLDPSHAYSVIGYEDLSQDPKIAKDFQQELVKIRNPHGGSGQWTGRWGKNELFWSKVPEEVKKALSYKKNNDGEFWMEFDDLMDIFMEIVICWIIKADPDEGDNCWHLRQIFLTWVKGSTAGGCSNNPTFFTNPQVQFQIDEHEEKILIVLDQRDTRGDPKKKDMSIGFEVFKVAEGNKEKIHSLKDTAERVGGTKTFVDNARQRCSKFGFEPDVGTYVIIPSTFHPNVAGKVLLRVLTANEAHVTELKD